MSLETFEFKGILERHERRISRIVETGTGQCATTFELAGTGVEVLTIEANYSRYELNKDIAKPKHRDIAFLLGDSAEMLFTTFIEEPMLFYLDAHYCQQWEAEDSFPLFTELSQIAERKQADIVIVDDVHTFSRKRPELGSANRWIDVSPHLICIRLGCHRIVSDFLVKDHYVIHLEEWLQ